MSVLLGWWTNSGICSGVLFLNFYFYLSTDFLPSLMRWVWFLCCCNCKPSHSYYGCTRWSTLLTQRRLGVSTILPKLPKLLLTPPCRSDITLNITATTCQLLTMGELMFNYNSYCLWLSLLQWNMLTFKMTGWQVNMDTMCNFNT